MAGEGLSAILLTLVPTAPASLQPCDFMAATGDAQYTATNVRAAPSAAADVIMTIDSTAPYEVHVSGRRGDWFRIDRIVDAEQDKQLFRDTAWVHRSQLVLSVAGGDHHLYARPHTKAPVLMRLTPDGNHLDVVGCKGRWVKAVVDRQASGWLAAEAQCSNPMTTCN